MSITSTINTSLTTNVISNVYNLGGTTACDAGTQTCSEGYSLYFPCLKDITKGQNVCFDFYVADTATQDVADLRDVDAITLELTGLYGCSYGDFSYPDDITSLQTEEYDLVYSNDFNDGLCKLTLTSIDKDNTSSDSTINELTSNFYYSTKVTVSAYDTPTHIFVGWAILTDEDECSDDSWDDYIFNKDNEYTFTITEDINLFAIYRERKKYNIYIDSSNKHSHYIVTYYNNRYHISNKEDEPYDDGYDTLTEVLEGYHMVIECVPNIYIYEDSDSDNSDEGYTYIFNKWKDGNTDRIRTVTIGTDTEPFETDNKINLLAYCNDEPVNLYDLDISSKTYFEIFDNDGIHIKTKFYEDKLYDYTGDEYTKSITNVYVKHIGDEGVLLINNGSLVLSSMDITDGIKIIIYAKSDNDDNCELSVTVNDDTLSQNISTDEYKIYEYYFASCEQSDIEIQTYNKCLIDKIEIYKETIINKGKASLCLGSDVTSKLPSGPLSVSGAIMVNGNSYGLATTQIGTVNKLKKITITL